MIQRRGFTTSNPVTRTRLQSIAGLAGWLLAVYVLAGIAALGSADAPDIYAAFNLPAWAPPAGLFGPAWSLLYTLMAVAAWLVWKDGEPAEVQPALALFAGQLLVNVLWSWLFFAWLRGLYAFLDILLLIPLVVGTIAAFWRLGRRLAAMLLLPYLGWICFAAMLNFSVWQLNPGLLG